MVILADTREQNGWGFEWNNVEVERTTIKYGDYTVKGIEDKIRIERKASTGELSNNLCTNNGWRKFSKEMAELQVVDSVFILCEFPQFHMDVFPEHSTIPKSKWQTLRVGAKFLRKRLYEIVETYGVKVIYCDTPSRAESTAFKILKDCYDKHSGNNS